MRRIPWLAVALVAGCALPPRAEGAKTPERAFETVRGALARAEFDRAHALFSDRLRGELGVRSRADFADWGAVGGRKVVKAIRRAEASGPAERLPDGRALLRVRVSWLFFGRDVRLLFAPVAVARVYVEGSGDPAFYDHLDVLRIGEKEGIVGVRLPPAMRERLKEGVKGGRVSRFEAGIEWFLDDFEMGDEERGE